MTSAWVCIDLDGYEPTPTLTSGCGFRSDFSSASGKIIGC